MKLIITKVTDDRLELGENGEVVITWTHDQDCCESVHADFSQLKDKIGTELPNFEIEPVLGSGFRIGGEFVPCYNKQNGYYSNNLTVKVVLLDTLAEWTYDMSSCCRGTIY